MQQEEIADCTKAVGSSRDVKLVMLEDVADRAVNSGALHEHTQHLCVVGPHAAIMESVWTERCTWCPAGNNLVGADSATAAGLLASYSLYHLP